jgi:peptidoglycan hydrolase-like protein with peptidoglycan-binding domain
MANLTLSVDEHATERARQAAQQMGTTLNQLLREQIERLGGSDQRVREAQAYLATTGQGNSGGWKFDRNELQRDI